MKSSINGCLSFLKFLTGKNFGRIKKRIYYDLRKWLDLFPFVDERDIQKKKNIPNNQCQPKTWGKKFKLAESNFLKEVISSWIAFWSNNDNRKRKMITKIKPGELHVHNYLTTHYKISDLITCDRLDDKSRIARPVSTQFERPFVFPRLFLLLLLLLFAQ